MTRAKKHGWWEEMQDEWAQLSLKHEDDRASAEIEQIVVGLQLNPSSHEILDVPSGLGRHCRELARRGFSVTGLDLSDLFLREAQSRSANKKPLPIYLQGDMRNMPLEDNRFDVVMCMYTSFGYFSDQENALVLGEMARVLRPGGRVLLQQMSPYFKAILADSKNFEEYDDGTVALQECSFDLRNGRLEDHWTYIRGSRRIRRRISIRLYTQPEYAAMAQRCGLEIESIASTPGGAEVDTKDPLWYVVARKLNVL